MNPRALEVTKDMLVKNDLEGRASILESDLFSAVSQEKFDVIIFNPPYVVTPTDELAEAQTEKSLAAAWAGGVKGIEVLLRFIPEISTKLEPDGVLYLLLIDDNIPILNTIDEHNLKWTVLLKREVIGERQFVVRVTK